MLMEEIVSNVLILSIFMVLFPILFIFLLFFFFKVEKKLASIFSMVYKEQKNSSESTLTKRKK